MMDYPRNQAENTVLDHMASLPAEELAAMAWEADDEWPWWERYDDPHELAEAIMNLMGPGRCLRWLDAE